jgi:hypothetical protein
MEKIYFIPNHIPLNEAAMDFLLDVAEYSNNIGLLGLRMDNRRLTVDKRCDDGKTYAFFTWDEIEHDEWDE